MTTPFADWALARELDRAANDIAKHTGYTLPEARSMIDRAVGAGPRQLSKALRNLFSASCPRCGALAAERDIVNGESVFVRWECGNFTGAKFAGHLYCDINRLREALRDLGIAFSLALIGHWGRRR